MAQAIYEQRWYGTSQAMASAALDAALDVIGEHVNEGGSLSRVLLRELRRKP